MIFQNPDGLRKHPHKRENTGNQHFLHIIWTTFKLSCANAWNSLQTNILSFDIDWLIDCMVFNAIFNSIFSYIAAASAPIHAFLEFF